MWQAHVKKGDYESEVQSHRIRITLTSQSTKNIEKGESLAFSSCVCAARPYQNELDQAGV